MEKREMNQSGITLVALVVTIVVLLILSGISVTYILGDYGIIQKSKRIKQEWQEAIKKEQEEMEQLVKKLGESQRELCIKVNVKSFNMTMKEIPIVYKITGKKDDKIVYQKMELIKVKNAGIEIANIRTNMPEGTVITVEEAYCGVNYRLTSEKSIEKTMEKDDIVEFIFEHEYNYKLIQNVGGKI